MVARWLPASKMVLNGPSVCVAARRFSGVRSDADELPEIALGDVHREARQALALPGVAVAMALDLLAFLEIDGRVEALDGIGLRPRTHKAAATSIAGMIMRLIVSS